MVSLDPHCNSNPAEDVPLSLFYWPVRNKSCCNRMYVVKGFFHKSTWLISMSSRILHEQQSHVQKILNEKHWLFEITGQLYRSPCYTGEGLICCAQVLQPPATAAHNVWNHHYKLNRQDLCLHCLPELLHDDTNFDICSHCYIFP